ncbi:MAG: xanthine dehydrogenase family protein [Deltaproteobacteria bacterium]|nr:xanthine dehydrogenase family protein [Deltaproteobacteria bacterium]
MSSAIGQNLQRVDGQEKVTGKGVYTGDLRLPGMVYGKVLRSPFPHARIRRIDASRAESLPGVVAVLTRDNLRVASPVHGAYVKDQPIVALEKTRYSGDLVAAVAAVDEAAAEEALKRIDVEYEELPAVFTVEEAIKEGAPLVHEKLEGLKSAEYGTGGSHIVHENSNILLHFRYQRGDVEKAFQEADFIFEDTFFYPSAQHYPLEPHVSVASFEGESLTVWTSTQSPFSVRQELARVFGVPFSRVRVIVPYVGGGYGAKSGIKTEALAGCLSRLAGRPVRVAFSADETFKTICQPKAKLTIKTGVNRDGAFVARRCEVYLNGGAYANSGPSVTEKAGYRAHGPYRIPHVLTDSYHVYTNTVPGGAFRGFGGPQAAFAYESHLDMIAHRLNMDPVKLRMKNLLDRGEEYAAGDTPMDCDLKDGLKQVAEAVGWGKEAKDPAEPASGSRVRRGKGIACGVKDGGGTNKPANAMVKILSDGSVLLSSGSVEIGQGMRTAFLQIVAQELSVPPQQIQMAELDTQYTPFDKGTNASSATAVMGQAVQRAARHAREQLLAAAACLLETQPSEVELNDGKVFFKGKSLSFRDAMRRYAETEGEIVGRGFFKVPRNKNVPLGYTSPFWEVGLGAAEVEVDEMTGAVRIVKYISLTDAGKMIHPLQCRGQDEGAALFGMGLSLSEEILYENGEMLNPNLVDYRLPRFRDLPESFHTYIREEGGGPGPYGSKGMGEGGILAVAPAICNAVYDATGVRIREVPLRGEKVWTAVAKGKDFEGPDSG